MDNISILYDILNEVSDSKSISEVATKLFISQPYVSKVIKQAEDKYGVLLVNRKKRISLTKPGVIILEGLRTIIEQENELNYKVSRFKKNTNFEIKIALNQPWMTANPLTLISFLRQKYPEITFSFYTETTNIAQDLLLNHSIDIFIGKVLVNEKISSTYLLDSDLYLVIPENLPMFNIHDSELSLSLLKNFDHINFISLTDESFFQTMINHMFEENEIHLNKVVKVADSIAATQLAIEGLGYTIAMKSIATRIAKQKSKKVKLIHIPTSHLQLSIGISYLKDSNSLITEIAHELKEFFATNDIFN